MKRSRYVHPADVLLRPYVEGRAEPSSFPPRAEAIEIAQNDLRAQSDSQPPPEALSVSRSRVLARVGRSDTGSFDLQILEKEIRDVTQRAAAEKVANLAERLNEEMELRKDSEKALAGIIADRRKFWGTVIAGVMIGLIIALVTWTTVTLVSHSQAAAVAAPR